MSYSQGKKKFSEVDSLTRLNEFDEEYRTDPDFTLEAPVRQTGIIPTVIMEPQQTDFNSLLTKRLVENLDSGDNEAAYTLKKGSYCLFIQKNEITKKPVGRINSSEIQRKVNLYKDIIPGPLTLGVIQSAKKSAGFNRKEIIMFEHLYKDQIHDTFIRVGKLYQAYIPVKEETKGSFVKADIVFGFPSSYKECTSISNPLMITPTPNKAIKTEEISLELKKISPSQSDETKATEQPQKKKEYIFENESKCNPIVESVYLPNRNLRDHLVWDPEMSKDEEIMDMIDQVLDEFRQLKDNPVTRQKLYDYLIMCNLQKETFLDRLEEDNIHFRKYLQQILREGLAQSSQTKS